MYSSLFIRPVKPDILFECNLVFKGDMPLGLMSSRKRQGKKKRIFPLLRHVWELAHAWRHKTARSIRHIQDGAHCCPLLAKYSRIAESYTRSWEFRQNWQHVGNQNRINYVTTASSFVMSPFRKLNNDCSALLSGCSSLILHK